MEIKEIISSGLLEVYALGMAAPEEILQIEDWVKKYPEVKEELSNIEAGLKNYSASTAPSLNDRVKTNIFNKIGANNNANASAPKTLPAAKVYSMSPIWQRAAAAAILLLIVSSIFNIVYYKKYKDADTAYNQANEQLLAQTEKVNMLDKDMSVVQNKYSVPVSLNGLEAAPDAAAKIFWMKNTGEVYIDPSNLPAAPEGKQYQLWGIVDGKPVDGGMIVTGKKGNEYHIQKMKTFGKAEAFAVTLESKGGNPTPKGDMYVMGKL